MSQAASAAAPAKPRWVVIAALRFIVTRPLLLLTTGMGPLLILFAVAMAPIFVPNRFWWPNPDSNWPETYGIAVALVRSLALGGFAIAWHRMALFGVDNYSRRVVRRINGGQIGYFIALILASMLFDFFAAIAGSLVAHFSDLADTIGLRRGDQSFYFAMTGVLLIEGLAALMLSQVFVIFPLTAIGERFSLSGAWRRVRGHYGNAAINLLLAFIISLAAQLALAWAFSILNPPTIYVYGQTPPPPPSYVGPIVGALAGTIITLFQYALLATTASLLYARMIGPEQVAALKIAASRRDENRGQNRGQSLP